MADCKTAGADTPISVNASCATFYELGLVHASGRDGAADLVSAHQWFNIAAMKGHADGARMRREIAAEMTDAEIGRAQRAARDWLNSQPAAEALQAHAPDYRAAA
jgi:TPR repeat protein